MKSAVRRRNKEYIELNNRHNVYFNSLPVIKSQYINANYHRFHSFKMVGSICLLISCVRLKGENDQYWLSLVMGSLFINSRGLTFVQNSFLLLYSTNYTSTSLLVLYTTSFVGLMPDFAFPRLSMDSFLKNAGLLLTYNLLLASICDMLEKLLNREDCLLNGSMLRLLYILGKELQRQRDWWLSTGMPIFLLADNYLLIQQQQLNRQQSTYRGMSIQLQRKMIY